MNFTRKLLRIEKGAWYLLRWVGYEKYHVHLNQYVRQSDWVKYLRGRISRISKIGSHMINLNNYNYWISIYQSESMIVSDGKLISIS